MTIIVVSLVALAAADNGVPETPETQGFSTQTLIQNIGLMSENDALVWQESNCFLQHSLPLYPEHTQYVVSYFEDTIADQGETGYAKTMAVDTRAKADNQVNLKAVNVAGFVGAETGRMVSEESSLLDGVGTGFSARNAFICPFATTNQFDIIPPYCNIVEQGSKVDLVFGHVMTDVEERHVTGVSYADAEPHAYVWFTVDYPVIPPGWGVEQNYHVLVEGEGHAPAVGSAEAYMNAHIMEGRVVQIYATLNPVGYAYHVSPLSEDIVYNEMTTATGAIPLFRKDMTYKSSYTGPPGSYSLRIVQPPTPP